MCKKVKTILYDYVKKSKRSLMSFLRRNFVVMDVCHCETPLRRCGNLIFSRVQEIASLIIFAHKDIVTRSRMPRESRNIFIAVYFELECTNGL